MPYNAGVAEIFISNSKSDQDQTEPGKTWHSENCKDKPYAVKTVTWQLNA